MGLFKIKNNKKPAIKIPPISYGKIGRDTLKKKDDGTFIIEKKGLLWGKKEIPVTSEQASLFQEKLRQKEAEERQAQQSA